MPEIVFNSPWLKLGTNTQQGDVIQFLNAGVQDQEGNWIFDVAVFRDGNLIEPEKKFQLNKGNHKVLAGLYGTNSDNWIHKEALINSVKRQNPKTGELVDGIALSAPTPAAPSVAAAPAAPQPDVPFEGGGNDTPVATGATSTPPATPAA